MVETNPQESNFTPEQEIRELEARLEAKKRELAEGAVEVPHEKEIFRGALREHIEERKPQVPPPATGHQLPADLAQIADEVKKVEDREKQTEMLIEIALTRSIADALKVAREATPWMLDDFHDHLADDFYEKLVRLRKINE